MKMKSTARSLLFSGCIDTLRAFGPQNIDYPRVTRGHVGVMLATPAGKVHVSVAGHNLPTVEPMSHSARPMAFAIAKTLGSCRIVALHGFGRMRLVGMSSPQ